MIFVCFFAEFYNVAYSCYHNSSSHLVSLNSHSTTALDLLFVMSTVVKSLVIVFVVYKKSLGLIE